MKTTVVLLILGFTAAITLSSVNRATTRRVAEQIETFLAVQGVQSAQKEIFVGGGSKLVQFWTEVWEDGKKTHGERPPPDRAGGPMKFGSQTSVYAAAREHPNQPGTIELAIRFPAVGWVIHRSVRLPEPSGELWALQFFAGDIAVNGSEPIELLAVTRSSIRYGRDLDRNLFADPDSRKLPTVVFKMAFLDNRTNKSL